jgi:hypothetical protein
MTVVAFVVAVSFMMIMHGCSPREVPATATTSREEVVASAVRPATSGTDSREPRFLEIKEFSQTEEDLRLVYRVTNVFPEDIWVCAKINQRVDQESASAAATEIDGGILQIRRRGNMRQNAYVTAGEVYAVYHRLERGASRCDTVRSPLPARDYSPVRSTRLPLNPVVLHRVVLELGYFRENLRDLLPLKVPSQEYKIYRYGYFEDPDTAFISYIRPRRWDGLDLEQFVQITISHVDVPAKIPGE